jgi:glycosyltransferase involved in cell wall biosynthesis
VHGLVHCEPAAGAQQAMAAWSRLQVALWQRADRVIFLSAAERAAAAALDPEIEARAHVVPNGLPRASGAPPPPARRAAPILFVGRQAWGKGIDLVVEAAPRLVAAHPAGVTFVGGHGDRAGREAVAALVRRFPGRCRDTGWLHGDVLAGELRAGSLLLAPSRYEPFGLAALEAMAAGVPVLAADVGGLRDVVGPGSGGVRLAHRDADAWAGAALDLLDDDERHRRLSEAGPAFVARNFAIDTFARHMLERIYCRDERLPRASISDRP